MHPREFAIIRAIQFVLIGLLSEMIRFFAFQPNEEYCVRQEFALRDDVLAYVPFVPDGVQRQQVPQGEWEQMLYPLSPQGWDQRQVDSKGTGIMVVKMGLGLEIFHID